jgi:hypothetical protein
MNRRSKRFSFKLLLTIVGVILIIGGWIIGSFWLNLTEVTPQENSDFYWSYYLYVPNRVEQQAKSGEAIQLLVLPNNTGTTDDNLNVHHRAALSTIFLGQTMVGEDFDLESYRQVPHFFFIGDQDENDSVPYDDGYEDEDEALIFVLFGPTPAERWGIAEKIYQSVGAKAEFRLYPGVGHRPAGFAEAIEFFDRVLQAD